MQIASCMDYYRGRYVIGISDHKFQRENRENYAICKKKLSLSRVTNYIISSIKSQSVYYTRVILFGNKYGLEKRYQI